MSTNNGYYVHTQGDRPHPNSLWPEPQHCIPQPSSQLSNSPYTVSTEAPQPFHSMGAVTGLSSDRILPTPVAARNYTSAQISQVDSVPVSTQDQRNSSCWTNETTTASHQALSQIEGHTIQEPSNGRRNTPYRIQDITYGQMATSEALSSNNNSSGLPLSCNETQLSPQTGTLEEGQQIPIRSNNRKVSRESLKSSPENTSLTYSYTGSLSGRSSQSRNASGQLSNGSLYLHTQSHVQRREPTSDDCSPDCSQCPSDSTRTSITSVSNTSSGY